MYPCHVCAQRGRNDQGVPHARLPGIHPAQRLPIPDGDVQTRTRRVSFTSATIASEPRSASRSTWSRLLVLTPTIRTQIVREGLLHPHLRHANVFIPLSQLPRCRWRLT